MSNPPRIVSHGWLLWEYMSDDEEYFLVGVVDSLGVAVNTETGTAPDEEEANKFVKCGTVRLRVHVEEEPQDRLL